MSKEIYINPCKEAAKRAQETLKLLLKVVSVKKK